MIFDFFRRILHAETLDALLSELAEFPPNHGCVTISLRQCVMDEAELPRLEPESFWIRPGSDVAPWTGTINLDDESLAQLWIISGGPPIFVENLDEFALFTDASRQFHQRQGVVSLYHILLRRHDQPIAVLSVMWNTPQTFADEHKALIEFAGWVLAPVIENVYLKRENERLSISIVELERKLQEAESALHSLAHDLKQPITAIVTSASLLDSYLDRLNKEQITEKVQRITRTGQGMSDWITSILLLAQVRSSNEFELQALNMQQALDNAIATLHELITQAAAIIHRADTFQSCPPVMGHPIWVEHIWTNLISNASKYGGTPPQIHISMLDQQDRVRFSIWDNGPGIPPDKLALVFEPFMRLHTQEKRKSGTGIGLTTVKLLVEKLGGEVGVEANTDGGTTFWFTLRKSPAPA